MKVILLGYMGSGKSTIGKILAKKMNVKFIDLDSYVSDKENGTINTIFKQKGEIYFRKIENKYLHELLKSNDSFVLALGGGTPCYANNMLLIEKYAVQPIYLKGSLNELYERLKNNKSKRPLIKNIDNSDLKEFIAKHLFERAPFYEKASQHIIIDSKSIDEVAEEIILNMQ